MTSWQFQTQISAVFCPGCSHTPSCDLELPFLRDWRANVGQRLLFELSIKRLNHLQQPELRLTFSLLFHPAEKKRYLVYELHIATQNEGMEVTGTERERRVVFCMAMPCFVPMESSMATARLPRARNPPTQDQMLLDKGIPVISVLESGLNNLTETHLDKIVSSPLEFPEILKDLTPSW